MPKTVVGLFENARLVDDAVHDIEALGCFMQKVRARTQQPSFDVTGVMTFAPVGLEVELGRELTMIGATLREVRAYVEELQNGGAMVFAAGVDENVCRRTIVMKPHGAAQNPEVIGSEYFLG